MNLIIDAWIPVRDALGIRHWIAPSQLSDANWVAFESGRADINGALAQFCIGLLQTASTVATPMAWRKAFKTPPTAEELSEWFAPLTGAFELDGAGPRVMQDFDLRIEAQSELLSIGALLIEAPGESTIKGNADFFVKRGGCQALCPRCAATALFTLQINAPAGGAGHRTSLRGGGPLTTLVTVSAGDVEPSLWHSLWANVQIKDAFESVCGNPALGQLHDKFPWLRSLSALQPDGGQVTPVQVHPAQVFWAMPRRIRLDFENTSAGICDLCGEMSDKRVSHYVTRPQGLNYKGDWRHPLSPYYKAKDEYFPVHPQPGGMGYRHWLGWVLGATSEKTQVQSARRVSEFLMEDWGPKLGFRFGLWAFGYDMDNMKARCWYECHMPLYELSPGSTRSQDVTQQVGQWLESAKLVVGWLRNSVKQAWADDPKGSFDFVDSAFWSSTEAQFYKLLGALIESTGKVSDASDASRVQRQSWARQWLDHLSRVSLHLFEDEWVGAAPIDRQNPARVKRARDVLRRALAGDKVREALGLPGSATKTTEAGSATGKARSGGKPHKSAKQGPTTSTE